MCTYTSAYTYTYIHIFFPVQLKATTAKQRLPSTQANHWLDSYSRNVMRSGDRIRKRATQMNHKPRELLCLVQYNAGRLNRPVSTNALGILLQMIVQRVNEGQCTKFLNRGSYKAKTRTNTYTRLIELQKLSWKLPEERAHKIMQ